MKKLNFKHITISLSALLLILSGCLVDEQCDIKNGGIYGANIYPAEAISYLKGETTEVTIDYTLFENKGVTVQSITVVGQLFTEIGDSDPVEMSVSGNPIVIQASDLLSQFPVGGKVLTEDDLTAGDHWEIGFKLDIGNGVVLTPANKTKITFTCPSDLAGMYTNVTNWVDYYGNPGKNTEDDEWVAEPIAGRYKIPDLTGGMEPIVWGNPPVEAIVEDVCGTIGLISAPYYYPYYIEEGEVMDTGVIRIKWRNAYDEWGVSMYTPKK
jgi:hypothetical protein